MGAAAAVVMAATEHTLTRFQLVVAATQKLGIGKNGTMPWKLPSDMAYFKSLTTLTSDRGKINAVVRRK
jgi:dihydrofolate reductase/thymidylate synthase